MNQKTCETCNAYEEGECHRYPIAVCVVWDHWCLEWKASLKEFSEDDWWRRKATLNLPWFDQVRDEWKSWLEAKRVRDRYDYKNNYRRIEWFVISRFETFEEFLSSDMRHAILFPQIGDMTRQLLDEFHSHLISKYVRRGGHEPEDGEAAAACVPGEVRSGEEGMAEDAVAKAGTSEA